MKNKIKTVILLMSMIVFMLPVLSMAAEFYVESNSNADKGQNYGLRSFYSILDAVHTYGEAWLDTPVPDLSENWGSNTSSRTKTVSDETLNLGCICFGHRTAPYGGKYQSRIKYVIDIGKDIQIKDDNNNIRIVTDPTEKIKYYRMAYYIARSTAEERNTMATTGNWKGQMLLWLRDNYGGVIQAGMNSDPESGDAGQWSTPSEPLYKAAQKYAESVVNLNSSAEFSTTSKYGEGQPQQINYNGEYTFIGPYNLTHKEGRIDGSARITTKEGTELSTNLYSTDGRNVQQLSSLGNYSGNNFYIVYKGEVESVQKIELTSKAKQNITRARIALSEGAVLTYQNIGIFYGVGGGSTEIDLPLTLPGVAESRLNIKKINSGTGRPMKDIGFVVYSVDQQAYVNTNNQTNQRYVKDIKEAEMFITDRNGEFTVNKLTKKGTYIIYEVVHPNAFNNGFEEVSIEKPLEVGRVTFEAVGGTKSITINNTQKYIRISGLVWEDKGAGKDWIKNYLYQTPTDKTNDENDKLVNHVTVSLKDSRGNVIQQVKTGEILTYTRLENGAKVQKTEQLEEGKYKFYNIEIDKISEYYVEFSYNGMSYQSVPLKDMLAANTSKAAENGRQSNARTNFNNKFKVITNNNANGDAGNIPLKYIDNKNGTSTLDLEGTNQVYGYEGASFPVNGVADKYMINATTYNGYGGYLDQIKTPEAIRRDETQELENINLGIEEREQPDLSVKKDLQSVKLTINGRGQVYEYDRKFTNPEECGGDGYEIGVKFKKEYGDMSYKRAIYTPDSEFTSADKDRELKVYLTYKLGIRNNSSNLQAIVNEIADFYDSRYEEESIVVGRNVDANANVTNPISFTTQNYNNDYKKIVINTGELGAINSIASGGNSKEIYVQFRLSREAVVQIMNSKETLDNVMEITSYSIFDKNGVVYAGIDRNSNPGNAVPGNKGTYEDDTDWAPPIQLEAKATPEEREISGKIFEDEALKELLEKQNIRQGNGELDSNEVGIPNVKVELWRKEVDPGTGQYNKWVPIKTLEATGTDGEYKFKGFAAGDYEVRFTWGDETYSVQSYKATIFNTDKHSGTKWYQDTTPRYSDARDDYATRTALDNELNAGEIRYNKSTDTSKKMVSKTNEMAIDIENLRSPAVIETSKDGDQIPVINTNGQVRYENVPRYSIPNVDFGLIERPHQSVELIKEMKHVKVTLANGQELVDTDLDENGKPVDGQRTNFTAIKGAEGNVDRDPGYAKLEIDNEILQGSTIEIKYAIKVNNTSEREYVNEEFYTYGTLNTANPVKINITQIADYADSQWAVNENADTYTSSGWTKRELSEYKESNEVAEKVCDESQSEITNRIILTTKKIDNQGGLVARQSGIAGSSTETKPLELTVTKVLTTIAGDIDIQNEAEVIALRKDGGGVFKQSIPGNYVPGTGKKVEPDDDMAQTFKVSPNTGENQDYVLPISVGIGALVILGVGVVWIKKLFGTNKKTSK